jgi:hypothetical protein
LLHQFVAEPTESKSFLVVADYHAKTYIRDARTSIPGCVSQGETREEALSNI